MPDWLPGGLRNDASHSRQGYGWSGAERGCLLQLYREGYSTAIIAAHHGRTEMAITCQLENLLKGTILKKYWMVHCLGKNPGTVQHQDVNSAIAEATRLAAANPGMIFNVLETVLAFQTELPKVVQIAFD